MNLRRYIGLTLLVLLVAGALAWGFWPQPVDVDVARVKQASFTVTVEEEGRTRVKDRFVISAPVAGYLQRIELDVGDAIAQGQVVARLDPMPSTVLDPRSRAQAESRVASARASLDVARQKVDAARAEAEYARTEYDRKQRLRAQKTVSEEEVDRARSQTRQAQANLRSAEFSVDVARFELEAAQTALMYSAGENTGTPQTVALHSPVAGRVLKLYRESEGVVGAGESLVEVGDPAALEVEVDLLSADAVRVHSGTRVRFERWGGEGALEGVVRTVEPVGFTKISALGVEEQRVWVIADITSPRAQWAALGDGYRVEASFILWRQDEVLQIPTSALFRQGEGWAVYAVQGGRARLRHVDIGQRSGLVAQVLSGLDPQQTVITHPDDRIEDGVRIRERAGN